MTDKNEILVLFEVNPVNEVVCKSIPLVRTNGISLIVVMKI